MYTCKICKRSLFTAAERSVGLCSNCRQFNQRCVKCGTMLVPGSSERTTGICAKCRAMDSVCHKCGKKLYGSSEKNTGLCDVCRRGAN